MYSTSNRSVARSASVIGFATLCSRFLGFIRDIVIARLFGVYIYAQAFVVAFRIPNLLRDLMGEGAANAAIVPVFSEYAARHKRKEFWELANVVLNLFLVVLMAITLLGIAFAPAIVRLMAPGFIASPEKLEITIRLTRIIFPYILLISLAAYSMGVLNSLKHFAVPAFAPCLFNISLIVFTLIFRQGIKGLALGVLAGGLAQLVIQGAVLYRKGFHLKLFRRFRHPAAKTIGILMVPRLFSSAVYQLNNFVDSAFGSLVAIVGEGGVAVLYFSYRLILFPLGIFSTALSQAILPTFSRQALEEDLGMLKQTLFWGLRSAVFLLLPASAGLMILARPIVSAIFLGGKFDAYSVQITANALFFYGIGLFAYGASKILQACFFALKDTKTPAKAAFIALIVNIVLNAVLMFPLKIGGIALATSLSGINTFIILFVILRRRLGGFGLQEVFASFSRVLAASICMGVIVYFSWQRLAAAAYGRFFALGLTIIFGIVSYAVFCFVFRVDEMRQLYRILRGGKQ